MHTHNPQTALQPKPCTRHPTNTTDKHWCSQWDPNRDPSSQVAAGPCLTPHGHRDQQWQEYAQNYQVSHLTSRLTVLK